MLLVAEKPATALRIAEALSRDGTMRTRGTAPLRTHECFAFFPPAGRRCSISVTSTCGHIFTTELQPVPQTHHTHKSDHEVVFTSKARKVVAPSSQKLGVKDHLQQEATGRTWLCLFLDCDREGESIGFEVVKALPHFTPDRVWRASFSSLAPAEVQRAMRRLGKPNPADAAALEARQELDLKVGVAFGRLLTRSLRDGCRHVFGLPSLRLLAYSPAPMAALHFCVRRAAEIEKFKPSSYFEVFASAKLRPLSSSGGDREFSDEPWPRVELAWTKGPTRDKERAKHVHKNCNMPTRTGLGPELKVLTVSREPRRVPPPCGLSTVGLLRLASHTLGLSPPTAMALAEELYAAGFISYPRTRTTRYPTMLDVGHTLSLLSPQPYAWGALASWLAMAPPISQLALNRGEEHGDHPPIYPTGMATPEAAAKCGGTTAWRLYEAICVHFIASMLPEAVYEERRATATLHNSTSGRFEFGISWVRVTSRGWLHAQPFRAEELGIKEGAVEELDQLRVGDVLKGVHIRMEEGRTHPPHPLREPELLTLLDSELVDGSECMMAQHLQFAVRAGYLAVEGTDGRQLGSDVSKGPKRRQDDGGGGDGGGGGGGGRGGEGSSSRLASPSARREGTGGGGGGEGWSEAAKKMGSSPAIAGGSAAMAGGGDGPPAMGFKLDLSGARAVRADSLMTPRTGQDEKTPRVGGGAGAVGGNSTPRTAGAATTPRGGGAGGGSTPRTASSARPLSPRMEQLSSPRDRSAADQLRARSNQLLSSPRRHGDLAYGGGEGAESLLASRGGGGGGGGAVSELPPSTTDRMLPPPRPVGRYVVPTPLGRALYDGLRRADTSLVEPSTRAATESAIHSIALARHPEGDYNVVRASVLGEQLSAFARRLVTLQTGLNEAFAPALGDAGILSAHTGRVGEYERGQNEMITRETLALTWSNGSPADWRQASSESSDAPGAARATAAAAAMAESRNALLIDPSAPLESPQARLVASVFARTYGREPLKEAQALAASNAAKLQVARAIGMAKEPDAPPLGSKAAHAMHMLKLERAVSAGVFDRIAAAERARSRSPAALRPEGRPGARGGGARGGGAGGGGAAGEGGGDRVGSRSGSPHGPRVARQQGGEAPHMSRSAATPAVPAETLAGPAYRPSLDDFLVELRAAGGTGGDGGGQTRGGGGGGGGKPLQKTSVSSGRSSASTLASRQGAGRQGASRQGARPEEAEHEASRKLAEETERLNALWRSDFATDAVRALELERQRACASMAESARVPRLMAAELARANVQLPSEVASVAAGGGYASSQRTASPRPASPRPSSPRPSSPRPASPRPTSPRASSPPPPQRMPPPKTLARAESPTRRVVLLGSPRQHPPPPSSGPMSPGVSGSYGPRVIASEVPTVDID